MAFGEKRAWVMAIVTLVGSVTYVTLILRRADGIPLVEVPYVATMLWVIGAAIAATVLLEIVLAIVSPRDHGKRDQRDRQIDRLGEYVGHAFVIIGGVSALALAMAEMAHFWIANTLYVMFALAGVLASVTKIIAYRRDFTTW